MFRPNSPHLPILKEIKLMVNNLSLPPPLSPFSLHCPYNVAHRLSHNHLCCSIHQTGRREKMEMEVMIPVASMDFDFTHVDSSGHLSCPSTPKRLGSYYFSAPTSPSRLSEIYRDFDHFSSTKSNGSPPRVPFDWEEKPGTPKSSSKVVTANKDDDFAFDFSEELEKASLSAEELFDGGKIRPLKPPPGLQLGAGAEVLSTRKPPLSSSRSPVLRERGLDLPTSRSGRRTRSLSPFRVSELVWEEEEQQMNKQSSLISKPTTASAITPSSSSKDIKNDSFRSIDSSGSMSKRRGPVSAHELHYTVNRAASEDLKKKTFLPYKQGILGRLAFNPALHALTNGFGTLGRG
ncbi:unnamed protein product, partial [Vitis vinifera]